jgi:C-terminal processing protease CtpA/Prc
LQDAHRATVIGDTTFGTGTVLTQFSLSDGSALMLAIEEWLTPSGRVIWHKGIVPDQTLALPAGTDPLTPEGEKSMTQDQLQASGDQQLLQSLHLLYQSANNTGKIGMAAPTMGLSIPFETVQSTLALDLSLLSQFGLV